MACWHVLLGTCALSILIAAMHANELRVVLRAAVKYARDQAASNNVSPTPKALRAAKSAEASYAKELGAALAGQGESSWAQWFGHNEASDDASNEDAVRLMLSDVEVLEGQWRLQAAERELQKVVDRATSWAADMNADKKSSPQRDRATRQAVEALVRLGKFLEDHGRAVEAISKFRRAVELASTLKAKAPPEAKDVFEPDWQKKLDAETLAAQVYSMSGLARVLCLAGGRQGAAVEEARALFTSTLATKKPKPQLEAQVHADFAECLHREGALVEARAGLAASRHLLDQAGDDWPPNERESLRMRLSRLQGGISHDDGAFADAIHEYSEYLQPGRGAKEGTLALPDILQRFEVMQDLALALASMGKVEEALASMDDVDRLQKSAGEELLLKNHLDGGPFSRFLAPGKLDVHLQASMARSQVVRAELVLERSRMGREHPPKEAFKYAQEAVALLRSVPASAEDLENALNTLGNVQMSLGHAPKARDAYREAVKLAEEDHGKKNPLVAALYHNLATALEAMGMLEEAVKLYTSALDIQLGTLGEANPDTAGSFDSLARCLTKSGLREEALKAARRAVRAARAAYPEGHWLRRESEARLKKLEPHATQQSSKGFLVSARAVHRVATS